MKTRSLAALIPPAGALCLAPAAQAALSFSTLTDTATAIPVGSGSFTAFCDPAQSLGATAFTDSGARGQQGIYGYDSAANDMGALADTAILIPVAGGVGSFASFERLALDEAGNSPPWAGAWSASATSRATT